MENYKSDRWVITSIGAAPGFQLPLRFKFTADETKELKKILRSFDAKKVQTFLFFLSGFQFISIFVALKERTFPKDAIEGHLKRLRQCRKTLKKILRGFDPDPQRSYGSMTGNKAEQIRRGETVDIICFKAAEKAYPHIQTIEKIFAQTLLDGQKNPGRQSDDEDFIIEIAKLYKLIFDKKPRQSKGTIFYKLIKKLLDIIDPLPDRQTIEGKIKECHHEPSGVIRRAMKKI